MSKCQCDLRTKLVGDGCRYCNAQEYIDKLIEALEEQRTWLGLTDEEANELWESTDSDWELMKRTEAKLKEKNL
jgi:hypothetical protein